MAIYHEGYSARQEGGVHEHAFAKWDIVRNGLGLVEQNSVQLVCRTCNLFREVNFYISNRQFGLIDYQLGPTLWTLCERHFPRPFARSAVLDVFVKEGVTDHRVQ